MCQVVMQAKMATVMGLTNTSPLMKRLNRKKAAEIGVAATVKSLSKCFHGYALKENSVHTWKDKYLKDLEQK